MTEEIKHYQVNGRYRVIYERAASTKGVDGFRVEANGDDIDETRKDAMVLYEHAKKVTFPTEVNLKC